jgi:DNA-directed RNA polymerase subunit K/omega
MKHKQNWTVEKVKGNASNVYEAVIIAAKKARRLNEERQTKLELMPEDDSITIDTRKVTEIALEELSSGEIEVER